MNEEGILDLLEVLEDQCFLLNLVRLYSGCPDAKGMRECLTSEEDVFLHPSEILKARDSLVGALLQSDPGDTLFVSALTRGISICVALLCQVFGTGGPPPGRSCHTLDEFDKILGQECRYVWTRSICADLIERVGKAFCFLCEYGTHLALPNGTWSHKFQCHLCKRDKCWTEIAESSSRKEDVGEFCSHTLRYRVEMSGGEYHLPRGPEGTASNLLEKRCDTFPSFDLEANGSSSSVEVSKQSNPSVGVRMRLARENEKLREARRDVEAFCNGFLKAYDRKRQIESPKCLNTACYWLVGRLFIYLNRRFLALASFSPLLVGPERGASHPEGFHQSAARLKECLGRVVMQKINNGIVREKCERILLDPISLDSGMSRLLRRGIVAKEFFLTFGHHPRDVCAMSDSWNRLSTEVILQANVATPEERLLYAVYILEVFNFWLSLVGVKETFHLQLVRSDCDPKPNTTGVVFLYDYEQVGLRLRNGLVIRCTYEEVLQLCVRYLYYLYEKGVCRVEMSVGYVINRVN